MAHPAGDFSVGLIIAVSSGLLYLAFKFCRVLKSVFENDVRPAHEGRAGNRRGHRGYGHGSRRLYVSSGALKLTPKKKWFALKEDKNDNVFDHPWLVTTLRGHTSTVLDMEFSPNQKYLATCGMDKGVVLWNTRDWCSRFRRSERINVKYDYASLIRWSPDSKAFIIKREKENVVEAYKINTSKGSIREVSALVTYPKYYDSEIIGLGLASSGKFVMICSNKGGIFITDLKGLFLKRMQTYTSVYYSSRISSCGRFIVASGSVPDVRVWKVKFNRAGNFTGCERVCNLTGHVSSVRDAAFDAFSTKLGTISKDGTWKLFDIAPRHSSNKETRLLKCGTYEPEEVSRIAVSPTADVIAITTGSSLSFYDTKSSRLDMKIEKIFNANINRVLFDPEGKYVFVCGDKYIRIFHNITGIKAAAADARAKLRQPNNTPAYINKLRQQISNSEAFLASYCS